MTKPEGIPEDIWDAAVSLGDDIPSGEGEFLRVSVGQIARAILAERARCAMEAINHANRVGKLEAHACLMIEQAIRSPHNPKDAQ